MMKANELSDALSLNIESLAVALLGNPTQRTGHEWRWGNKGSLAVVVKGPKRGRFFDHERGEGGDGLDLVRHGIGGSLVDAMRWASDWLGVPENTRDKSTPYPLRATAPETDDSEPKRIEAALRIWGECQDINGTLAAVYLASRKIGGPIECEDLCFHPRCPAGEGQRRPAMVALLRDIVTNEPCGIHRTFLLPDGAGKDPLGKKMLGRSKGAVIKLAADADVTQGLGIAEGIENALTLRAYGWWPLWAAGSAGAIRTFPIIGGIETLTIFADSDDRGTGAEAARECALRWREFGCLAEIHYPPAGSDWNDVAREIAA